MDKLWQPLVICGKTPINATDISLTNPHAQCTFNHLMLLANHLITDLIVLSTFLAVAVFVFVGIKLLTSGGNEGAMKDAKAMLMKVVIGYLWILGAWVLVYTITNALLDTKYLQLLGKPKPI